jgi:hypothetical protein
MEPMEPERVLLTLTEVIHVFRKRRALVNRSPLAGYFIARRLYASLSIAVTLRDDDDFSKINWRDLAEATRQRAEAMLPGTKRNAEMDTALACEAMAHSADKLLRTQRGKGGFVLSAESA